MCFKIKSCGSQNCSTCAMHETARFLRSIEEEHSSLRYKPIDYCPKDDAEKFFTKIHCNLNRIPIQSLRFRNQNAMHLGKKFLAAIFSAIIYYSIRSSLYLT